MKIVDFTFVLEPGRDESEFHQMNRYKKLIKSRGEEYVPLGIQGTYVWE
jgi:NAD-dependent dihydropyrimidine dehydrogenase PreA subunit